MNRDKDINEQRSSPLDEQEGPSYFKAELPLLNFGRLLRLPVIMQTEAAECGLACLAMISCFYRNKIDLPRLRQQFPISIKGATLSRLMEVGQAIGLSSRALRLEPEQLKQLQTPCVLHWELNHFVVLKKVHRNKVEIHDPAYGARTIKFEHLNASFTGVALEVSPGPTFKRKKNKEPLSLTALAGSVQGLGRALLQMLAMAIFLELLALLAPQFVEIIVDQVLADQDRHLLTVIGVGFSLILVAQVCVSAMRTWAAIWIGSHFNLAWSGNVFQHLLRLPQEYFLKRHLGDIVSRFGSIVSIQQTITTKFVEIILDGVMATLTFVMLMVYSPTLALVTVSAVVVYIALRAAYYKIYRESSLGQVINMAKQQGTLMESIRGVQTIRVYNQVPSRTSRFLNQTADVLNASIYVQKLQLIFDAANSLSSGVQRLCVLWVGAWLAMDKELSAGMLMAYLAYADQFTTRATSLIDYGIKFRLLRIQGERLADIVLTSAEEYVEGTYTGEIPETSLSFFDVSYRYSVSDPWILRNCDMHIFPGEFVAIVGPSGCGKSTLARLILGLLDPEQGKIEVGGINVHRLGKRAVRNIVASVMQDDQLFSGTIAENISLFDYEATSDSVEAAAKAAELHPDIVSMPMGYFSLIGDMGSSLSGGQQQRLLLARALYRKPKILVLDEATSHLDLERERKITRRLREMSITRVVIAHRPETIRAADRVLELRNGVLIESEGRVCAGLEGMQREANAPVGNRRS